MSEIRRIALALQIDEPYPQHQQVYAGVQRYARQKSGWRCLIDEFPAYDLRHRGVRAEHYDGVIARATQKMHRRLQQLGIPLVNTHFQTAKAGLPGVYPDPQMMGRLAAEHLLDRGFRQLGILSDPAHKHSGKICQGYIERLRENRIDCQPVYFADQSYGNAKYWLKLERCLVQWLAALRPPVALFIESFGAARLMVELSQSQGWHIPQDLAILCQHDIKAVLEVSPQISSIDPNYECVGFEAARLLDRLMAGAPAPSAPIFIPPRGVIARESTDYFAVEDEVVAAALRFISGRLGNALRLEQIAQAIAVSPRTLQQRFAASLGRGVSDEVRRLRLETAKRMLAEPEKQISHIADRAGFGSADVMNQIFRRELGMTPRAYRKQMMGDKAGRKEGDANR